MKAQLFIYTLLVVFALGSCTEEEDSIVPEEQKKEIFAGPKLSIEALDGVETMIQNGDSVVILATRKATGPYAFFGPSMRLKITGEVLNEFSTLYLDNVKINENIEIASNRKDIIYEEGFFVNNGIGSFTITVKDKADSIASLHIAFSVKLELEENDILPATWTETNFSYDGYFLINDMIGASDNSVLLINSGKVIRSSDDGNTWSSTSIYGMEYLDAMALHPNGELYITSFSNNKIAKSTDNGASWNLISTNLPNSDGSDEFTISPDGTFYLNVFDFVENSKVSGVWKSKDGLEWENINGSLGQVGIGDIKAMDDSTVFVGTGWPRRIFKTTDGGKSWEKTSFPEEEEGGVNDMLITGEKIYVATLDGAFVSEDKGETWTKTFDGNPGNESLTLKLANGNDGKVLMSPARYGVFSSTDKSGEWQCLGRDLGSSNVNTMINIGGKIYAATEHGKVFRMD